MTRFCNLNLNELAPFEVGSILIGLLCFPSASDEKRWQRTATALASSFLHRAAEMQPAQRAVIRADWPEYRVRQNRSAIQGLAHRSRKALEIGGFLLAQIKTQITDQPGEILPLTSLMNVTRPLEINIQGSDNRYKSMQRDWHRWLPIGHLAAAYRYAINVRGAEALHVHLDDIDFHRWAVATADRFAAALRHFDHKAWLSSDPIQLTWIETETVQNSAPIS